MQRTTQDEFHRSNQASQKNIELLSTMTNTETKGRFEKLGRLYILALSGIAVIIISTQILIQNAINKQQDDSRLINVAGRQRMLSQQISKNVLKIKEGLTKQVIGQIYQELYQALRVWKIAHQGLLHGNDSLGLKGQNSTAIREMFRLIHPHYTIMVASTEQILTQLQTSAINFINVRPYVAQILAHERDFLQQMNNIVFQYDEEAQSKILSLRQKEIGLLIVSLLIIFLEIAFIFIPTSKNIKKTVRELIRSGDLAKKMATEIEALYQTLETSYQQLADVDIEADQPTLFIKTDNYGAIGYFSEKFQQMLGFQQAQLPVNLFHWLEREGYQQEFLDGVMDLIQAQQSWNGELKVQTQEGDFLWLKAHLIPVLSKEGHSAEVMVVASNITELKEAQERSQEINREKIEKQVEQKQYRSVLILEGQEEERKRIARDIHDGIGQMLIALKLTLESTITSNAQQTKLRIQESREVLKNIIKEVRRVSFNLTPSSLSDFGLTPTIKKFCREVSELMGINVTFENQTHFINRLNTNVETHLYRIIQEAVNNAIKHAKATEIRVVFTHNLQKLSIEIVDNGIGFDYVKLQETGHFAESKQGIFNIKERAHFINGQFEIDTAPGQGTRIKVSIVIN